MNLYKLTRTEREIVVYADSEKEALKNASSFINEDIKNYERSKKEFIIKEISSKEDLPKDWEGNCIPYGASTDISIDEILNTENFVSNWLENNKNNPLAKILNKIHVNEKKSIINKMLKDGELYVIDLQLKLKEKDE